MRAISRYEIVELVVPEVLGASNNIVPMQINIIILLLSLLVLSSNYCSASYTTPLTTL